MELKIGKITLSVTSNGNPKANIFPEGADYNNIAESIEIIGDDVMYLSTRKPGETIEVVEKGKWKNIAIPSKYLEAVNSPAYERVKLQFKRSIAGINKAVNGDKTQIDFDTAKVLMLAELDIFLKSQNFIVQKLTEYSTDYTKTLIEDLKSEDTVTKYKSLEQITDITRMFINNLSREYKLQNDAEVFVDEIKNVTKKKKKS